MLNTFECRPPIVPFPLEPFRTSRDPARSWRQATVIQHKSEWWLVHPEIAGWLFVPGMMTVDLHDCVCRDGLRFVLAVFESNISGLREVLDEAASQACDQWVRVEKDEHWSNLRVVADDSGLTTRPVWPMGSFMDQLRRLFQGRCICSEVELHALFHEPSPDPVLDIFKAQFPAMPKVVKAAPQRAVAR